MPTYNDPPLKKCSLSPDPLVIWWALYCETMESHYTSDLPRILSHVLNLPWSHRSSEFRLPADVNSQFGTWGLKKKGWGTDGGAI